MTITLYPSFLPDHIIQGTPGPPCSVLYILLSCWSGVDPDAECVVGWEGCGMAGSSLIATSLPATVCTPEYTEPHPPTPSSESSLYLPPKVHDMLI